MTICFNSNFKNRAKDWSLPSLSEEAKKLLRQCSELAKPTLSDDIEDIIQKSNEFPIDFPIESVR